MGAALPPPYPCHVSKSKQSRFYVEVYLHGNGAGKGGREIRSFWAAWLGTSAGHAARDDLGRSTRPLYCDTGAELGSQPQALDRFFGRKKRALFVSCAFQGVARVVEEAYDAVNARYMLYSRA